MIFRGAFTPDAIVGAGVGVTIKSCITWGVKRGVFSNEAGLGSAPIAHAASSEKDPVKQGLYGIFEVFMDTIVICSLTGITLLISGVQFPYGVQGGNDLMVGAFAMVMGNKGQQPDYCHWYFAVCVVYSFELGIVWHAVL